MSDRWEYKTFGEITEPVDKSGPHENEEFDYIEIGSINNRTKRIEDVKRITAEEASSRASRRLKKGDVLISRVRPKLNGVAIVPEEYDGAIGTSGFYVVRSSEVLSKFIYYYAQTGEFIRDMDSMTTGSSYPSVNLSKIREYKVPVPPEPQQERIIKKAEEFDSKIQVGTSEIEEAKEKLERYEESVLKFSFRGKLTEQWREDNSNITDASHELEETLTQLEKESPSEPDEKIQSLPETWTSATLDQISTLISGRHIKSDNYNQSGDGTPYLTGPSDFGDQYPEISKFTNDPKAVAEQGDVLITVKGMGSGKTNLLDIEKAAISRQLAAIRPVQANPKYIFYYILHNFSYFQNLSSGRPPGISREPILETVLPLPPRKEQDIIVDRIDEKMSVAKDVTKNIDKEKRRAQTLRGSILQNLYDDDLFSEDKVDEKGNLNSSQETTQVKLNNVTKQ